MSRRCRLFDSFKWRSVGWMERGCHKVMLPDVTKNIAVRSTDFEIYIYPSRKHLSPENMFQIYHYLQNFQKAIFYIFRSETHYYTAAHCVDHFIASDATRSHYMQDNTILDLMAMDFFTLHRPVPIHTSLCECGKRNWRESSFGPTRIMPPNAMWGARRMYVTPLKTVKFCLVHKYTFFFNCHIK
ncbi:hypothetical protein TNCV_2786661 [Trichonephila clavipes]|nr:hypothetical protein TNCV_2786661 [Trichonephila clavipes]